jgi:hypothetical protein
MAVNCPSAAAFTDTESTISSADREVDWLACAVVPAATIAAENTNNDSL